MSEKFTDYIKSQRGKILAYIRKNLGDAASYDAEDLFQDAVMSVVRNISPGEDIADIGSYIYKTVRNRIIDRYRKKEEPLSLDSEIDSEGTTLAVILADTRYDLHNESEKDEIREKLFAAIDSLTTEQKAVWTAVEMEGHSFKELSVLWDVPIGTLLSRKKRADDKLKIKLSGLSMKGDKNS